MCVCLVQRPCSSSTCPFHWVGGKVKRGNVSTLFIPRGNSHPSGCHQAATSCHFQPYTALGAWLRQRCRVECAAGNIAKLRVCASLPGSWKNPSAATEVGLVFLWQQTFCQFPFIPLQTSNAVAMSSRSSS